MTGLKLIRSTNLFLYSVKQDSRETYHSTDSEF